MPSLGCVTQYDVGFITKDGLSIGTVTATSVSWQRRLDQVSEAVVDIAINQDCCDDVLSKIAPWHSVMVLFRDGVYVWSGPVISLGGDESNLTITARDGFALLARRFVHSEHCFDPLCGGSYIDPVDYVIELAEDALGVDRHGITIERRNASGLLAGFKESLPGNNALSDIEQALPFVDVTFLGPKMIVGVAPFGTIATLTPQDFGQGGLQFFVDGEALTTRGIVNFDNDLTGIGKLASSDVNGEDPYYGLLESQTSVSNRAPADQTEADYIAGQLVAATYPANLQLVVPDGSTLSPNAPVGIQDLVPGVALSVIATFLCRELSGQYILLGVDVTMTADEGELVRINLGVAGSNNAGTFNGANVFLNGGF